MRSLPSLHEWHQDVQPNLRAPLVAGALVLAMWLIGFGAWALFAPLEGAIIASGTFVATGQNKSVQHLEGGIIRDSLVKEGDLVEKGDLLIRLDDTGARAKHRRLVLRRHRLTAMQSRLASEVKGELDFIVPASLAIADDQDAAAIVDRQKMEMQARSQKLEAEKQVLRKEIAALQEGIAGFEARVRASETRLDLFGEELDDKQALLKLQLARKSDVFSIRRAAAGLTGELGELQGRIADAKERIARAEQQIAQLQSASTQRAIEELRATEAELDDVIEQIRASKDVLDRTDVKAPVRGIVVRLNQHTGGGVIAPGAVILELLPVDDGLVLEARVRSSDVIHIEAQKRALVRFSALNQRVTPMINAHVSYVSADVVSDASSNRQGPGEQGPRRDAYVVRLRLDESDLRAKIPHFKPSPGMPAEAYIQTSERSFFDYLMKPVSDSFSRAFREQ